MEKLKNSIIHAALDAVTNLRSTADRLERAANARDFRTISKIALSTTTWTLDAIRGAALAAVRLADDSGDVRAGDLTRADYRTLARLNGGPFTYDLSHWST